MSLIDKTETKSSYNLSEKFQRQKEKLKRKEKRFCNFHNKRVIMNDDKKVKAFEKLPKMTVENCRRFNLETLKEI